MMRRLVATTGARPGLLTAVVACVGLFATAHLQAQPAAQASQTAGAATAGRSHTVAVISLGNDPRYTNRRLERGYPGHPLGRLTAAAEMAAADSAVQLSLNNDSLVVREATARTPADLPGVFSQLKADRVRYWLLDLPPDAVVQAVAAAGNMALLFNASASSDTLRGSACAAQLFHTAPSDGMLSDALAQYLAARNWRNVLLLQGPEPADQGLGEAWQRSAKRYGLRIGTQRPFKLSGDPRERDLANPRLLTSDRNHDVVAVLDSDGEFARTLPYATQQPRPVVGSNGLMAATWHVHWERNGGPQVNRRFQRAAQRPMAGQDWAAWVAVKAVASVLQDHAAASPVEQARALRSGSVVVDGAKGPRLSFRAWDGQLRQPIFISHADGVVGTAPLDGVLHPTEVLDTLGFDEKESACKARP